VKKVVYYRDIWSKYYCNIINKMLSMKTIKLATVIVLVLVVLVGGSIVVHKIIDAGIALTIEDAKYKITLYGSSEKDVIRVWYCIKYYHGFSNTCSFIPLPCKKNLLFISGNLVTISGNIVIEEIDSMEGNIL